ncbi:MAG: hypothetical protein JOZ19_17135 [Rubrobacter sp.]|nr:hypothetical protein [Rubrobacter sp.]
MKKTPTEEIEAALQEADLHHRIPRWPAIVALFVIVVAYLVLSESLKVVSREVILGVLGVVVAGTALTLLARLRGRHLLVRSLAIGLIAAVTLAEATSILLLVALLPRGEAVLAPALLRDAAIIWGINVVTFALWYWEIDGGGSIMRRLRPYQRRTFCSPSKQHARKKTRVHRLLLGLRTLLIISSWPSTTRRPFRPRTRRS